jgi:hypothetical protein
MATFTLRRVRINGGGYDSSGRYWGSGQPLYHYSADLPEYLIHVYPYVMNCDPEPVSEGSMKCRCGRELRFDLNIIDNYIRADNREHAKAKIRAKYPDAKFYR